MSTGSRTFSSFFFNAFSTADLAALPASFPAFFSLTLAEAPARGHPPEAAAAAAQPPHDGAAGAADFALTAGAASSSASGAAIAFNTFLSLVYDDGAHSNLTALL